MTQSAQDKLRRALAARKADGTLRALKNMDGVDFSSNDYLGLSRVPLEPQSQCGEGSTGSRLITGHDEKLSELESYIAGFHGFENALLFSSGYAANAGLMACLGTADDVIISDTLIHASSIDGIRLSYAKRERFLHNDMADLEAQLIKYSGVIKGQIFVVAEALYSMDGDTVPLAQMAALCEKYDAALIIDEAHSIGIYGEQGRGLIAQLGLQDKIFAAVYTYGKAPGLQGAVICGSDILKDYLINFCRTFIYTTAPSLSMAKITRQAYQRLETADTARAGLTDIIAYFQDKTRSITVPSGTWLQSESPIQGLLISGNDRAKALASYLQGQGFAIKAILSPTVAQGQERLRISLHSFNTHAEIDALMLAIETHLTAEIAA